MWFYIQNIHTGMVLDIKNSGKGTKGELITYPYHGNPNQLFRYDERTQMIHSKLNGQVLDINQANNKIIIYPGHGGLNQKWTFDHDNTIKSRLGKVMDVKRVEGQVSGDLIAYPKHGGSNQQFRRVYV